MVIRYVAALLGSGGSGDTLSGATVGEWWQW